MNFNRAKHWLSSGAKPTQATHKLLSLAGILPSFPAHVPDGWSLDNRNKLFLERIRKQRQKVGTFEEHIISQFNKHEDRVARENQHVMAGIFNRHAITRARYSAMDEYFNKYREAKRNILSSTIDQKEREELERMSRIEDFMSPSLKIDPNHFSLNSSNEHFKRK